MPKKEKGSKKNKQDTKYNAENEIIIGVTTKPKEKVRVENKKSTRTNTKSSEKKKAKSTNSRNAKVNPKLRTNKNSNKKEITKDKQIKKLNRKKILISIIVLILLVIGGTIYYLTTPIFNVSSVIVYGNNKNSVDTYISLSGININATNIFAFTNSSIEKRIKENSYVEDVTIEKKLPNIVELHITERTVDYQVSYLNSYIYINNQGYILEINEEEKDVPIIEGLSSIKENIELGQRLNNEDLMKLDTILKVTNYIKYNSVESKLTSVDASDVSNYILQFKEEEKTAYIGDSSSITEKMTAVAKILEAEEGKKGKIYANEEVLKRNRVYFSEEE